MSDASEKPPHPLEGYPRPPPRGIDLPYDDGEPMESQRHFDQMSLLIHQLQTAWRDREDFYVGGNMFLYFSETQSRGNEFRGPDVFVVLDTVKKERRSWVIWEENGRAPSVVIELLSPTTEAVDRGEKMRLYGKVIRVPAYYLYDPFTQVLEGYQLGPEGRYERIAPNERGRVPCAPLGLELGIEEGEWRGFRHAWLFWYDADGRRLPDEGALAREAEAKAREAEAKARAVEARAREAEEHAREAEQRAADAESRAAALAARLAELEGGSS